jgi:hypothetical protein
MRAAAGDVVSPPGEEAARQLKEQGQFEGACQESSPTARRHGSSRAAGPTGSTSGSASSGSGGAGQAAGTGAGG